MILAMAYSRRDEQQALRLMRWIGFLAEKDPQSQCWRTDILLVPSQSCSKSAYHRAIAKTAADIFRSVAVVIPDRHVELGWPASPNYMFKCVLSTIEAAGVDMFFIEPDAIPVTPDWLWQINQAFAFEGKRKRFLGGYVNYTSIPHMTGVACYSHQWRECAPRLGNATDIAWDVWSADQVLPNAAFTELIQHVFFNPKIETLDIVQPGAVIFHQDKTGALIRLLDKERWGGSVQHSRWSYDIPEYEEPMRYFHTFNASRIIKAGGFEFLFEAYDQIGGIWAGIASIDDPAKIDALVAYSQTPTNGVSEIDEAEFVSLQKKNSSVKLPNSEPYAPPQRAQLIQRPALLVDGPSHTEDDPAIPDSVVVENLESIIKLGKIKLFEPARGKLAGRKSPSKRSRLAVA